MEKDKCFVFFRIGKYIYWQELGTDMISVSHLLDDLVPMFEDILT